MTPFPAPPATAVKEAIEKTGTSEWIDELEAYGLGGASPDDIQVVVRRHHDRGIFPSEENPLRSALRPWAGEMARLFRIFPLAGFNVLIRGIDKRLDWWVPQWPCARAALDSEKLWKAQRAFETAVARFLVREYGEIGFDMASLTVRADGSPPLLFVFQVPGKTVHTSEGLSAARDWLEAMRVWLDGIDTIAFTVSYRPLSAHERLEVMRPTDPSSSEPIR